MPRPYLVGCYYALDDLVRKLKGSKNKKLKFKFWRKQLEKKYFWYTDKERIEANKKCFDELRKINLSYRINLDDFYN